MQTSEAAKKLKIFIGSSSLNLNVARAVQDCLASRGFHALVWDEGLFEQNESTFDGLLRIPAEVDFAVFIWGASDVMLLGDQIIPSPRDNVVYETGLFLGALGKDRVFIVADQNAAPKIPSDFNGITRSHYDGSLLDAHARSAVSSACSAIENRIKKRKAPAFLTRLQGRWKSRFASGPLADHPTVMDEVEIIVERDVISMAGKSGEIPYTGEAKVYNENQIIGQWAHPSTHWLAKGSFMLLVSPTADSMYGYFTSQDADGSPIFGTWVFVRENGRTEEQVLESLLRGQAFLRIRTVSPSS